MKGDRFERLVALKVGSHDKQELLNAGETVALLRKEHAAVRKMVVNTHKITVAAFKKSILAALDRRKMKGSKV